jgi:hypothetical protein
MSQILKIEIKRAYQNSNFVKIIALDWLQSYNYSLSSGRGPRVASGLYSTHFEGSVGNICWHFVINLKIKCVIKACLKINCINIYLVLRQMQESELTVLILECTFSAFRRSLREPHSWRRFFLDLYGRGYQP